MGMDNLSEGEQTGSKHVNINKSNMHNTHIFNHEKQPNSTHILDHILRFYNAYPTIELVETTQKTSTQT